MAEEKMIEEKVIEILKSSNIDETSEAKVRKLASEQLGLDLSQPDYKKFVRGVVNSYLVELSGDQENKKEEVAEVRIEKRERGSGSGSGGAKEYDDNGDLVICRLSSNRKVTWTEFKGKRYVSIREYYTKDGKQFPSTKGISLTPEQWARLKDNAPAIEEAIKKSSSS